MSKLSLDEYEKSADEPRTTKEASTLLGKIMWVLADARFISTAQQYEDWECRLLFWGWDVPLEPFHTFIRQKFARFELAAEIYPEEEARATRLLYRILLSTRVKPNAT